eukprot:CAMPEP_0185012922 /NCGR_PEP_ID=MMETSP1098-20130426/98548_1 /TAXON_ID=89044 /ORGANISM="Spumella elongata, Strain CCAP 955/1" /LENGTH=69 /DNA_ID=CAMNT_0027541987 /DNA_START=765 /DNA_END=974 /DNA_ORIENTATION=-
MRARMLLQIFNCEPEKTLFPSVCKLGITSSITYFGQLGAWDRVANTPDGSTVASRLSQTKFNHDTKGPK